MDGPGRWRWVGVLVAGFGMALLFGAGIAGADTGRGAPPSDTAASHSSPAAAARTTVVSERMRRIAVSPRAAAPAAARPVASPRVAANRSLGSSPTLPPPARSALGSRTAAGSVPDAARTPTTNGVAGVKTGESDLVVPVGAYGYVASADWYFPAQSDTSVQPNGMIWLQHGLLADKSFYAKLASQLAQQTNSVVVVPNLPAFPTTCSGCSITGATMQEAAAAMFVGDRGALTESAIAAGYVGNLPDRYILAGHSAGGGFATSVAGYTVENGAADNGRLLGVVMFDGVSSVDAISSALQKLDSLGIPVYQIAAPAQAWNGFGATTDQLLALRPDQFDGVTLAGGSPVDSMVGTNRLIDSILQLLTRPSTAANTAATYTLSAGWINDLYVGAGPADPEYGFYAPAGQKIAMGDASAISLAGDFTSATPTKSNGVAGVKVGSSDLSIPCGPGYVVTADWYLPTQADGSVQANGVIWLQHGLLGDRTLFVMLARQLAQRTNSIVVAPTITSFPMVCNECWVYGVGTNKAIANMFLGDRPELNASANAAGYQGILPQNYILAGHSIGGGIAAAAAGYSVDNGAAADGLLGVVMFDGVGHMIAGIHVYDTLPGALESLDTLGVPVYQIASPPQTWNNGGITTDELSALRPGQFVGVLMQNGSHSDAILDSIASARYALVLSNKTARGNTAAVYTLATGWINDMYYGAGPQDPHFGIYGDGNDSLTLGDATAVLL